MRTERVQSIRWTKNTVRTTSACNSNNPCMFPCTRTRTHKHMPARMHACTHARTYIITCSRNM